jgi:uncharacterized membrane protein YqjE
LSLLALGATLWSGWAWQRKRQAASALFAASGAELAKDRRAVELKPRW